MPLTTFDFDGVPIDGGCFITQESKEAFLKEDWPWDDNTVFIVKHGGEFKSVTGVPNFTRWLMDPQYKMQTFFAYEPTNELQRLVMARAFPTLRD